MFYNVSNVKISRPKGYNVYTRLPNAKMDTALFFCAEREK